MRIYGRIPFSNHRMHCGGFAVYQATESAHGGYRPVYTPPPNALAGEKAGTLELTLFLLGIIRLMLPEVLLPATTALGTIHPKGRELGILAGANVVMPNLSPKSTRHKYMLYDNKICTGDEAAECLSCMKKRMEGIGCRIIVSRGDHKSKQ